MADHDRLIGGRYRIVKKLAEGGMGEVFEAQHNLTKSKVALKILFPHIGKDEAARQRFLREVSAPAQIGHDGIVKVDDAGFDSHDGALFVAMEFLDGEPLRDRLARGGHSLDQILDWFEEVLDPLAAAHEAGIVHRDLKPENVMFTTTRQGKELLKVLDFGIARDLDGSATNVTHTGIAMGTPHYMAPEQAMSAKGVTAAADVWAMGCMLYEALAGRTPFDGETASAIVVNACTKAHAPLIQVAPNVPPPIAAFVDRCLDKEALNRPQNAGDMLAGLRAVRSGNSAPGIAGAGVAGHMPTGPAASMGGTPPPGGYTPAGTAVLNASQMPSAPGYGTGPIAPGAGGWSGGSHPGTPPPSQPGYSSPGMATGGGWSQTAPPTSAPGYGTHPPTSGPGYGTQPPYSAPGGFAPPKKKGGGMMVVAALLIGGLVVVGLAIVGLGIAMSGDDEDEDVAVSTAGVTIQTNVSSGELFVDNGSRGPLVPGQQFRIERGDHSLEIRENGSPVAQGTVSVVAGQDQVVQLDRVGGGANVGGGAMIPGNLQTFTGQLRPGDVLNQEQKYEDTYPFDWAAGANIQILLDGDFDTYLRIISPSGQMMHNDDRPGGGLNSGLNVQLSEGGRWTVVVTSFGQRMTGDYTLQVTAP